MVRSHPRVDPIEHVVLCLTCSQTAVRNRPKQPKVLKRSFAFFLRSATLEYFYSD